MYLPKYYQPLDLTVNRYAKHYFKNEFNEWYLQQASSQLACGINLEDIEVNLKLSLIKPIHAAWVVDFCNHMTTANGVETITSGWKAAGILDAVELGSSVLPSIDPFDDIDPLLSSQLEDSCKGA